MLKLKCLLIVGLCFLVSCGGSEVFLTSKSPSGKYTVELEEINKGLLDVNFVIKLTTNSSKNTDIIFRSPDEREFGKVKIEWIGNEDAFVLSGNNFFIHTEKSRGGSMQDYVLYNLKTGESYCNAYHMKANRFTDGDIEKIKMKSKSRKQIENVDTE